MLNTFLSPKTSGVKRNAEISKCRGQKSLKKQENNPSLLSYNMLERRQEQIKTKRTAAISSRSILNTVFRISSPSP